MQQCDEIQNNPFFYIFFRRGEIQFLIRSQKRTYMGTISMSALMSFAPKVSLNNHTIGLMLPNPNKVSYVEEIKVPNT